MPTMSWPPTIVAPDHGTFEYDDGLADVEYKFLVYESLSGVFVGELPITYASYSNVIRGPGGAELHMPIQILNSTVQQITSNDIEEYRHIIAITRDDVCVWAGFIAKIRCQSSDNRVYIACIGYWDYFRNRFYRHNRTYGGDILAIARDVVQRVQAEGGPAQLNIVSGESTLAGVNLAFTTRDYDMKTPAEIIEDLARSDRSFDFRIQVDLDTQGTLSKRIFFGYPKIGTRKEFVVEFGRNVSEYQYQRDGDQRVNQMWGIGAGEASDVLIARASDTASFATVPLREGAIQRKEYDSSQLHVLQGIVNGEQTKLAGAVEILSCTLIDDDAIGAFIAGDSLQVVVNHGFTQLDTWMRLLTYTVRVQDNASESIDMELGPEWATGG